MDVEPPSAPELKLTSASEAPVPIEGQGPQAVPPIAVKSLSKLDQEVVDQGEVIFCEMPRKKFETALQQWASMTLRSYFKRTSTFTPTRAIWVLRLGRFRWIFAGLAAACFSVAFVGAYLGKSLRHEYEFALIEGENSRDVSKALGEQVPIFEFPYARSAAVSGSLGLWLVSQKKSGAHWSEFSPQTLYWRKGGFFQFVSQSPSPLVAVDIAVTERETGVRRVFRDLPGGELLEWEDFSFRVSDVRPGVTGASGLSARVEIKGESFWIFHQFPTYDATHRKTSTHTFEILDFKPRKVARVRWVQDASFLAIFFGLIVGSIFIGIYWLLPYRKWVVTWTSTTVTLAAFSSAATGQRHRQSQMILKALMRYLNRQAEKAQKAGGA